MKCSDETKFKLHNFYKNLYYTHPKYCKVCNQIITFERRKLKTCSEECAKKAKIIFHNHCGGGYRKGSGRSKHGWYNGIYCDSTYELVFLIYCLDHNIEIRRCEKSFEYEYKNKKHKYYPDFIINNNEIIEIKGYSSELVKIKATCVNNENYKILFKPDLKIYFDYVLNKFSIKQKDLVKLYDKYTGKLYKYKCTYCGKQFEVTKPLRKNLSNTHFCSRHCCGLYRQEKNCKNNYINYKKVSESLIKYNMLNGRNIYREKRKIQIEKGNIIRNRTKDRIDYINNLPEDFFKRGWINKLSKYFKINRNNMSLWLKRNMYDLYTKYNKLV